MKLLALLAILSLTTAFSSAYAAETDNDNAAAYCNEQAQKEGIEDAAEKEDYIKECANSFAAGSETPASAE